MKLIRKIKSAYLNLRLQSKFILIYIIIISIPLIAIAGFFYGRVYNMIVADTLRNEQQKSSNTAPLIEEAIDQILNDASRVQNLPFYEQVFNIRNSISVNDIVTSPEAAVFSSDVESILKGSPIQNIKIYTDLPTADTEKFSSVTDGIFDSMLPANATYWKGIFGGINITTLFCPTFYLNSYEIKNYGDMAYIIKKQITSNNGEIYDCYTAFYFSSQQFTSILKENLPSEGSVAYLINDRDAMITTTNPGLSSTYYLNYAAIQESFMSSNNFLQKTVLEEVIYAGMYNIQQPQWYMVVVIPSSPLIQKSQIIILQYLFLFIGCILISLFIAITLSRSITKRLSMVTKQMAKVRTGPPIPLKQPDFHDEIGDLIDTFNYMSNEMNQLLTERALAAEELRIAEFNSLQAQINPHFLYNTMDMINWMAAKGQTDEITSAVRDLSRFYKLTLSKKETISNIEQEIEHANIYVRLQNMRFSDSIEFVVDIPDELLEYEIPKLTLQPVIENCILHGVMEKESKQGTIVLTGWLDNNSVELLISDDGIGISEEKMANILSGEGKSKNGTNIAIYNTHHRLQILYGEEYGLSYKSTPGKGTDVSIHLPDKKKDLNFYQHSIIQVSGDSSFDNSVVEPQALLQNNRKLADNTYLLSNISKISDKLPPKEPFYILTHDITEDFPAHTHDYFELSYCSRGSLYNCIDGNELVQSNGDLFLLNTKAVQTLKLSEPDSNLINFIIRPELFNNSLKTFYESSNIIADFIKEKGQEKSNYLYFPIGHNAKAQSYISSLIQEYIYADFHHNNKTGDILMELFYCLADTDEYSIYGVNKQTHEILEYIKEHCIEDDLPKMLHDINTSESALFSYIRSHTGRDLEDIINDTKINMAIELLQKPDMNIYDVASACGYKDPNEFFSIFYRRNHITPEEYRKEFL